MKRLFGSRLFMRCWCAAFLVGGAVLGVVAPERFAQSVGWMMVGFQAAVLIFEGLRTRMFRDDMQEVAAAREMAQRDVEQMFVQLREELFASLRSYGEEHGMHVQIDVVPPQVRH